MNKKILKTDKLVCIDRRIDHIRKSVTTNVESRWYPKLSTNL